MLQSLLPNNHFMTASTATPVLVTSFAMAARMQLPVQKFAEVFNKQAIIFGDIPSFQSNYNAFNHSKKDIPLSAASACKTKSRAVLDIVVAVKHTGSLHHQVVALDGAMLHPDKRCMEKSICIAEDAEIALFHQEQQKKVIATMARKTTMERQAQ
jgi:hypothetical protein